MDIPHDGSLVGRIEKEIEILTSRIPSATTIPAAYNDIKRTIELLGDARRSIKLAAVNEVLKDLERQAQILNSEAG